MKLDIIKTESYNDYGNYKIRCDKFRLTYKADEPWNNKSDGLIVGASDDSASKKKNFNQE